MRKAMGLLFLVILALPLMAGCAALLSVDGTVASEAPPEELVISVQLATDEFLGAYEEYLDLSWFEEGDQRIAFTSNMLVRGFRFIELGYDDGFYVENILIEQKELLPDRPLVVTWAERGETRGISFLDEAGEPKYFALHGEPGGAVFSLAAF